MRKVKFVSLFVLLALLLSVGAEVGYAQESIPSAAQFPLTDPPPMGTSPSSVVSPDKELTALWEKYDGLIGSGEVSLEELQELIAGEKSEKAKLLGIKIKIQEPSATASSSLSGSKVQPSGLSLCIRPIWGPGKAVWNFPNPGQNGAKYSVLPESSYSLVWAQPPQQGVDGLYRASWGGCLAYKIPDSATATFQSAESWEVCYNAFACSVLGHCPKWVNPCDNNSPEGSWPDYPLW